MEYREDIQQPPALREGSVTADPDRPIIQRWGPHEGFHFTRPYHNRRQSPRRTVGGNDRRRGERERDG